jgi:hypothetical protein
MQQPFYSPFTTQPSRSMPTPPHQAYPAPPQQLRPVYFIYRSNNTFTPLLAADELPFNVRLAGVPRVMRVEETCGMQNVGMALYTGMTYQLEKEIYTGAQASGEVGGEGMQRSTSNPGHVRSQSGTPTKFLAPDAVARQALAQSASNAAAVAANGGTPSRPTSAHEQSSNWRSTYNPTSTPMPLTAVKPTFATSSSMKSSDNTQAIIDAILALRAAHGSLIDTFLLQPLTALHH